MLCAKYSQGFICQHYHPLQGRPVIICIEGDQVAERQAFRCLQVPHMVDCLQGILTVIPLQLLSFQIAVLRGYDVSLQNIG